MNPDAAKAAHTAQAMALILAAAEEAEAQRYYRPGCGCYECDETRRAVLLETGHMAFSEYLMRHMIVCPDCGNKRCPHSTHHGNACTGSNEPNQPGSRYQYAQTPGCSTGDVSVAAGVEPPAAAQADAAAADGANRPTQQEQR